MSTITPILELDEMDPAQSQPELIVNAAIRALEVFGQIVAISREDPTDSPFSPADGDVYIVPEGTTIDDWALHENDVAYYAAGWHFLAPRAGWIAFVEDEDLFVRFSTASPHEWVALTLSSAGDAYTIDYLSSASPGPDSGVEKVGDALDELYGLVEVLNDLHLSAAVTALRSFGLGLTIAGKPGAAAIYHVMLPIACRLPASLTDSLTYSGTNATSSSAFTLKRNGVSIGTLSFSSGGATAAVSFTNPIDFAAGDRLTIEAPAVQDATLANVSISLKALRI